MANDRAFTLRSWYEPVDTGYLVHHMWQCERAVPLNGLNLRIEVTLTPDNTLAPSHASRMLMTACLDSDPEFQDWTRYVAFRILYVMCVLLLIYIIVHCYHVWGSL